MDVLNSKYLIHLNQYVTAKLQFGTLLEMHLLLTLSLSRLAAMGNMGDANEIHHLDHQSLIGWRKCVPHCPPLVLRA